MNTPDSIALPAVDARSLLKSLQRDFQVFRETRPLAIGIDKQILARHPEIERKALRVALGMHTHATRYLKAVANGTERFNLDGSPADALTGEHRQYALEALRERLKKDGERRKAQQALEAAERERTAKLGQLVAKFGRGA